MSQIYQIKVGIPVFDWTYESITAFYFWFLFTLEIPTTKMKTSIIVSLHWYILKKSFYTDASIYTFIFPETL